MFNRIVDIDREVIIYNSANGTDSIMRVKEENVKNVKELLTRNSKFLKDDDAYTKLVAGGYLVPIDVDEKAYRNMLISRRTTHNVLYLIVHITNACNFRCKYCYMDFGSDFLSDNTQQGIINFVKKNIHKYNGLIIDWFGGEPLLGVDIIERISEGLIGICKRHKKPYTARITTNGYELTSDIFNRLLKCRVLSYTITIDGTQELHDRQRVLVNGGPTFDKIINNLRYIRENSRRASIGVTIRGNLTKEHSHELDKYYSFFNEHFGDDNRFDMFVRPVADYGGEIVKSLADTFLDNMTDTYKSLSRLHDKLGYDAQCIDLEVGGSACVAKLANKFTIGTDGSIHKCDEMLENPVGYLQQDGKLDIDPYQQAEWIELTPNSVQCDDCFYSCCCMMELCPKTRMQGGKVECQFNLDEIDAEIVLAATTLNAKTI